MRSTAADSATTISTGMDGGCRFGRFCFGHDQLLALRRPEFTRRQDSKSFLRLRMSRHLRSVALAFGVGREQPNFIGRTLVDDEGRMGRGDDLEILDLFEETTNPLHEALLGGGMETRFDVVEEDYTGLRILMDCSEKGENDKRAVAHVPCRKSLGILHVEVKGVAGYLAGLGIGDFPRLQRDLCNSGTSTISRAARMRTTFGTISRSAPWIAENRSGAEVIR
jgi:hypothetical protein